MEMGTFTREGRVCLTKPTIYFFVTEVREVRTEEDWNRRSSREPSFRSRPFTPLMDSLCFRSVSLRFSCALKGGGWSSLFKFHCQRTSRTSITLRVLQLRSYCELNRWKTMYTSGPYWTETGIDTVRWKVNYIWVWSTGRLYVSKFQLDRMYF